MRRRGTGRAGAFGAGAPLPQRPAPRPAPSASWKCSGGDGPLTLTVPSPSRSAQEPAWSWRREWLSGAADAIPASTRASAAFMTEHRGLPASLQSQGSEHICFARRTQRKGARAGGNRRGAGLEKGGEGRGGRKAHKKLRKRPKEVPAPLLTQAVAHSEVIEAANRPIRAAMCLDSDNDSDFSGGPATVTSLQVPC